MNDESRNTKPKVLAVDDEIFNLEILEETLEDRFNLFLVSSGEACLEFVSRCRPDIILMDANMPGINGFQTCEKLKQINESRDIPVVFVTALGLHDEIEEGYRVGGVKYIVKPFDTKTLLSTIYAVLGIKK